MELKVRRINTGFVVTLTVDKELAGEFVFEQWHYDQLDSALDQVRRIADFMCMKSHKELRIALKKGKIL